MKPIVKTLLIAAALAALSTPALAHPPRAGHHGHGAAPPGVAWVPVHAPRHHGRHHGHGGHGKHYRRHGHHRHGHHRHGAHCGHPWRGAHYRPRHPTYGAYGASLTLRLDDVWLSVHGRR